MSIPAIPQRDIGLDSINLGLNFRAARYNIVLDVYELALLTPDGKEMVVVPVSVESWRRLVESVQRS